MKLPQLLIPLVLSLTATFAWAGETKPFSPQEFERLNQAGKPVVVDVSATWCPTCKAQKPIVKGLMKQPAYQDVTLLTVDFDSEKAVLKQFKVNMQSTLVAFKGNKEVARSVGDTSQAGLEALFKKAVGQ